MLTHVLLAQQGFQTSLDPSGRFLAQALGRLLPHLRLLGQVVEQLLIVDLPAQSATDPTSDGGSARPGLSAHGDRQTGRHLRPRSGSVAAEAVPRSLTRI